MEFVSVQINVNVVWVGLAKIVLNVFRIRIVRTVIVILEWNVSAKKDGVDYCVIKVRNRLLRNFVFIDYVKIVR